MQLTVGAAGLGGLYWSFYGKKDSEVLKAAIETPPEDAAEWRASSVGSTHSSLADFERERSNTTAKLWNLDQRGDTKT